MAWRANGGQRTTFGSQFFSFLPPCGPGEPNLTQVVQSGLAASVCIHWAISQAFFFFFLRQVGLSLYTMLLLNFCWGLPPKLTGMMTSQMPFLAEYVHLLPSAPWGEPWVGRGFFFFLNDRSYHFQTLCHLLRSRDMGMTGVMTS